MINRIVEWSANNPFLVFLLTGAALVAGYQAARSIPLDAIPDLSETQVIIYSRWDRSPDIMENQVTYPIVTAMLGAPKVKDVRGISDFGASYVYVIFNDGVDLYWARSRAMEYLAKASPRLPAGVKTELGPDATGLGWVFQYALVDTTGKRNLADLRSLQDWYLRYHLQAVAGVAEVASVGGFVRQYQINLDPHRLQAYNIPITKVIGAVRAGNSDVGGRLLELSGREYMVRGRGYAQNVQDLGRIAVGAGTDGLPIRIADVGSVVMGPELRRGAADFDGKGEAVCGIVVTRIGENALRVIDRVKAKLKDTEPGLPPGVKIVTTYDRSELILNVVRNLKSTLIEELIVVALVILIFLWHFPSAIVPIVTIPITVLIAFGPMRLTGMSADALSLGGIAIAVGAMVDAAIVVVEQTYKKAGDWQREGSQGNFRTVVIDAIKQVASPSFFSLLVIAVSFLPVLALESEEGRLFRPLAFTKSLSMLVAAVLAITLDPALRLLFTRTAGFNIRPQWLKRTTNALLIGNFRSEERHPISRRLIQLYTPVLRWNLRRPWLVIAGAAALVAATIPVYQRLGSEFMPPLDEGSLLFMPTTLPGVSLTEARRLMRAQNQIIASFPEVERVSGKAGRADSATDPAPPSMIETTIVLKPKTKWPTIATWYDGCPEWIRPVLRHITSDRASTEDLLARMDHALHAPGVSNAWTMPIRNRIEMQSTGFRTPVGVKVTGADPAVIEGIGEQVEAALRRVRGTRSVFAERTSGGYFLDFDLNRDELARYGLTVDDAQTMITNAIGGENVTTVIRGAERYPVNVRYLADFRSSVEEMGDILVPVGSGQQRVPLREISSIRYATGPGMLRNDNGLLTGYVYADVDGRDLGGYVADARRSVHDEVKLPPGYALIWSGQYQSMERVKDRLTLILPLTAFLIVLLLHWNTRTVAKTSLVLLAAPFSAVGAIWLLYALGYNLSVAVWVGLIALMGIDAETGVFMLMYLDLAFEERMRAGRMQSRNDLEQAILEGGARRIRPKLMTVTAMLAGLLPILWSMGAGSDVMKRIAAPLIGGIVSSFILELAVYPVLYQWWRGRKIRTAVP